MRMFGSHPPYENSDVRWHRKGNRQLIRVCMITARFYPEYGGGARQALQLCLEIRNRGISPFVVTRDYRNSFSMFDTMEDRIFGVRVFRLPSVFEKGIFSKLWFVVRLLAFLACHHTRYEVIHVHGIRHYTYPVLLLAKGMGKKVIVKMTCFGVDDPLTLKSKRFGRQRLKLLSLADRVIGVSSELCNSYRQSSLCPDKLIYIPNGVDTEKFKGLGTDRRLRLRDKLGVSAESLVVVFIGSITKRKGADLLIQSWEKMIERFPISTLVMIGPRDENEGTIKERYLTDNLLEYLRNKGLKETVIFTGYLTDVREYLQISDIFVLPTNREGLPTALLEAMACGVAPLATRLDSLSELIRDKVNGLLFEPGKARQLSECLILLAGNTQLRRSYGRASRKVVLERYCLDVVADDYAGLYRVLLSRRVDAQE